MGMNYREFDDGPVSKAKPDPVREMATKMERLVGTFDSNADGVLGLKELQDAKGHVNEPEMLQAVDFTEKNFGTISILDRDNYFSDDGISSKDVELFRYASLENMRNNYLDKKLTPYMVTGGVVGAAAEIYSWFTPAGVPLMFAGAMGGGYISGKDRMGVGGGILVGALAWGPAFGSAVATLPAYKYYDRQFTKTIEPEIRNMYSSLPRD